MPDSLNLKGLTFLLADSDSFFIRLVRGILRGFGATHIVSETDGQRAFDLAAASLVDMVICDAFLPRLDGFQLCRAIRQDDDQALRFVPVIILTSHTQSQNVQHARDVGATAVLAKPISPALLHERLQWVAADSRPFVKAPDFLGPERRFRESGPPANGGRRHDDPDRVEKEDDAQETRVYNPGKEDCPNPEARP